MTVRHATPGFLAGPVLAHFTCLLSVAAAAQTGQQPTKPSASDIADQLSNPNASLGILSFPIDFTNYGGALPDAGGRTALKISAQPIFPYPRRSGLGTRCACSSRR